MTAANEGAGTPKRKRRKGCGFALVLLVLLIAGGLYYRNHRAPVRGEQSGATTTAKRAPLLITVTEGGNIATLESQEIKSEVRGETKILKIIEEGHLITQTEIDAKLVLVEMDAEKFQDNMTERKLALANADAAMVQAQKQYEIQEKDNESARSAAALAVKFARMDFERFLGEKVAGEIVHRLNLDASDPAALSEAITNASKSIDFEQYAGAEKLGDGEAKNLLRRNENAFRLSEQDVRLATTRLEGTKRLLEHEFVTKNELENDQLTHERKKTDQEAAQTSQELFMKYDFPKMAEKLLSDYVEALRKQDRAEKVAVSQLAQAEVNRQSAKVRFDLQVMERDKIQAQIDNCTIRATKPGMVVYGAQNQNWYSGDEIKEGATVRERQVIITIPDPSVWALKVKVHESYVKLIKPGQIATMRVDAFPDEVLTGKVQKVNTLPDTENRWMNPDVKVYETTIVIDGQPAWLKPGLTSEAEILIERIDDVLQVPIQAIYPEEDQQYCYIARLGRAPEHRLVKTGVNNEVFVQILDGLKEGESVLLKAPVEDVKKRKAAKQEGADKEGKDKDKDKDENKEKTKASEEKPAEPKAAQEKSS